MNAAFNHTEPKQRDSLRETLNQVRRVLGDLEHVPRTLARIEARVTRETDRACEEPLHEHGPWSDEHYEETAAE